MTSGHTQFSHLEDGTFLFSQTAINKFGNCPEYARVIWSGEEPEDFGAEAMVGIAAHAGIAAAALGDDPRGAIAIAVDAEWDRVMFPPGSEPMWPGDVIAAAVEAARIGAKLSKKHSARRMGSELELISDLPYGRHPKRLRGTIDEMLRGAGGVHDFGVEILDWKVSRSIRYSVPQFIRVLQREAVQPTVYSYLSSKYAKVAMDDVLFTYIAIHPESLKVYEVEVHRDEGDIRRLAAQLDAICDMWLADLPQWPVAPAGHWFCSERWCSHFTRCVINN